MDKIISLDGWVGGGRDTHKVGYKKVTLSGRAREKVPQGYREKR